MGSFQVLRVVRLRDGARLPTRGSNGAGGWDLFAVNGQVICPNTRVSIPLGLSITVPDGTYGRLAGRSSVALRHGVFVTAGVIDRDYTGEVGLILFSIGINPYIMNEGDRIGQLLIERIAHVKIIEYEELEETQRGCGGFGSTGQR